MTERPEYARVIADSISPDGVRLTTIEMHFWRAVLAEFNTHRVFSRNSASSRAIPFAKQARKVLDSPYLPLKWAAEQKGMQGGDEIEDTSTAKRAWWGAANDAVRWAQELAELGVHKSVVNRLLEPFLGHTVVVTSTAWDNFLVQRYSPDAMPEIELPAKLVREALMSSFPQEVKLGEYHLPYIRDEDRAEVDLPDLVKISAARCARTSYENQDGVRSLESDLSLYERLYSADPMHSSPFEHVATPAPWNSHTVAVPLVEGGLTLKLPKVGNFLGWRQHRLDVELAKEVRSYV